MMASTSKRSLAHLPALDGLRGVALLGVLFFHANGLSGGFLGVDLFFVVSGFLITSLLLREHENTGTIDLKAFWSRRARRLFPGLLLLMSAIAVYARFVAKPSDASGLRADASSTLLYFANWRAIFSHKSYWEIFATPSPLEHTWSLAIEEQFYLVWPVIVLLLSRFASKRRAVFITSVAMSVLSMMAMVVLFAPEKTSRVYFGTDTRAAAILMGAALAAALPANRKPNAMVAQSIDILALFSIGGLAFAWVTFSGTSRFLYHGGFWLTEIAAVILVLCAAINSTGWVVSIFSFPPLRGIGTISYGLYLWHWPINVVVTSSRVHVSGVALYALQFSITFVIAIASYFLVERPLRSERKLRVVLPVALGAVALLLFLGTRPRPSSQSEIDSRAAGLDHLSEPVEYRVMMLGDSTANSLGWALRGVRQPGVAVDLRGQDGCTMLLDTCHGELWPTWIAESHPDTVLLFFGGAFLHGLAIDGEWSKSCTPGWDRQFEDIVASRLVPLRAQYPNGVLALSRIWLMTLPYPLGPYENDTFRKETDCINASLRKVAKKLSFVRVFDLAEMVCPEGHCTRESDGIDIRPDGVHYDVKGAAKLAQALLLEMQQSEPRVEAPVDLSDE